MCAFGFFLEVSRLWGTLSTEKVLAATDQPGARFLDGLGDPALAATLWEIEGNPSRLLRANSENGGFIFGMKRANAHAAAVQSNARVLGKGGRNNLIRSAGTQ